MRVMTVVGARPQFIKAAAVSRAIAARPGLTEVLVHSGQHYDAAMSDVFFEELAMRKPDHHLGVGSGPHGAQTGRMLEAIERVLLEVKPHWVLVYGDTNTTLAGALAASKHHVPVAHVEAGLRSRNRRMPEELNRVLTDHASDLLLAPTAAACANLAAEGVEAGRVRLVGDVMFDVARFHAARAEREATILRDLGLTPGGYVLATIHRAENTDDRDRLAAIFAGLAQAARRLPVVFPLHPRTRAALTAARLLDRLPPGLKLVPPVGYLAMVQLERHAAAIATDSGGVQKEAFFFSVPCVTLRTETEWPEAVDLGWNRLVPPTDPVAIAEAIASAPGTRGRPGTPYGDGQAAEAVVDALRAA